MMSRRVPVPVLCQELRALALPATIEAAERLEEYVRRHERAADQLALERAEHRALDVV